MKNALKIGLLGILAIFMIVSCTDDLGTGGGGTGGGTGGGGTTEGSPEIILVPGVDLISSDATVAVGEVFSVQISAAKGAADLRGIFFDLDGLPFPNNGIDITIDGIGAPSNGVTVAETEASSLSWNVTLPAHDDISTRVYSFIVQDQAGLEDRVDINITTTDGSTGGGDVVAPTLDIPGGGNIAVMAGSLVKIDLNVQAGNPALSSIGVFEVVTPGDSTLVDIDRLYFGDCCAGFEFTDNPNPLVGDDVNGFEKPIYIRAQEGNSATTYVILLVDADGRLYRNELIIDTNPIGNPVTELIGVLFNRAGPAGTGGLDLDSGASTGSAAAEAELKDSGIDSGASDANNWLQTFSGINGTEVKELFANTNGVPENFSFEDVTVDRQIEVFFGAGQDFVNTNLDGEVSSDAVSVGDTYVALKDGKYYLFVVREVNVSPTDNSDNYVFDIKF